MILPVQVGIRDDSVQGLGLRASGLGFRVQRLRDSGLGIVWYLKPEYLSTFALRGC